MQSATFKVRSKYDFLYDIRLPFCFNHLDTTEIIRTVDQLEAGFVLVYFRVYFRVCILFYYVIDVQSTNYATTHLPHIKEMQILTPEKESSKWTANFAPFAFTCHMQPTHNRRRLLHLIHVKNLALLERESLVRVFGLQRDLLEGLLPLRESQVIRS